MVTLEKFTSILLPELPEKYRSKAHELFTKCGDAFSDHVANSLINALENNRVPVALERIEKIYHDHIEKVEPEMRCIAVITVGPECFSVLNHDLLTKEEIETNHIPSEPLGGMLFF